METNHLSTLNSLIIHRYTLTVMCDFGGAFAWIKNPEDRSTYVGRNVSMEDGLLFDENDVVICDIPKWLVDSFNDWQLTFEKSAPCEPYEWDKPAFFDWKLLHVEGLFLAALLQQVVGKYGVLVRYQLPSEDPQDDLFDPVTMTPSACTRAKTNYLKECVPLMDWCFDTLRNSLLATNTSALEVQSILDQSAKAWGLPSYVLGIGDDIVEVVDSDVFSTYQKMSLQETANQTHLNFPPGL